VFSVIARDEHQLRVAGNRETQSRFRGASRSLRSRQMLRSTDHVFRFAPRGSQFARSRDKSRPTIAMEMIGGIALGKSARESGSRACRDDDSRPITISPTRSLNSRSLSIGLVVDEHCESSPNVTEILSSSSSLGISKYIVSDSDMRSPISL